MHPMRTSAILMAGCILLLPPSVKGQGVQLAITGGTLIDGTGAPPVPDGVVTVRDGIVVCVGSRGDCPVDERAQIIDATGRWLIPGLIDTHIHWQAWYDAEGKLSQERATRAARTYLANGITTVIDVGGQRWVTPDHRRVLREVLRSGEPAPRMLFSGWIDRRTVDSSESRDASVLARSLLDDGVDGLKIRNGLSVEEYEAIVAEADRMGRPVYGHTYYIGDREFIDHTAEAVEVGVDGVFHVLGIPPSAPDRNAPLPTEPMEDWETWWLAGAALWSYATDESMDALIRVMVENGAWLQPTLVTEQIPMKPDYYRDHPNWKHSPATWEEMHAGWPHFEGEELEQYRAAYGQMQKFVRLFQGAGGMIVAGTDGVPIPGFGLQEELRLLVEAGVPPMVALQSATRNAAVAWRWQDRIGTLEAGMAADLLILDGNPLEEIDNIAKIWRVVRAGTVHDPTVLLP